MMPEVKFEVAPLEQYLETLHFFLNPGKGNWNWSEDILKNYPLLKEKLKEVKDKEKRIEITNMFFAEIEKNRKPQMKRQKEKFQKEWDKINNRVMKALSYIAEIKWPEADKRINAFITLNPICPRYLKYRAFDVFYASSIKLMKKTCLHEIFHFIYFEKWKQVFPETDEKEFEAPYLVWFLSEMVPSIALKNKKVQEILKHNHPFYKSFKTTKIKGIPILSHIQKFYNKRGDFADFLRKSWKFAQENEKEIKQSLYRQP